MTQKKKPRLTPQQIQKKFDALVDGIERVAALYQVSLDRAQCEVVARAALEALPRHISDDLRLKPVSKMLLDASKSTDAIDWNSEEQVLARLDRIPASFATNELTEERPPGIRTSRDFGSRVSADELWR